jgi:hypothetical protein
MSPAQPGQGSPGEVTAQTLLLAKVLTQIELDAIKAQVSHRGQLTFQPAAAHIRGRIVQGIRDDHYVAAIATDEGCEVLWMVAHPKRRQVQPHRWPPPHPGPIVKQVTLSGEETVVTSRHVTSRLRRPGRSWKTNGQVGE